MSTDNAGNMIRQEMMEDPELATLVEEELQLLRLSEIIKKARLKSGLTQKELAQRLDTKQSAISRIENSEYDSFSMQTLLKIAKALGYNLQIEFVPQ